MFQGSNRNYQLERTSTASVSTTPNGVRRFPPPDGKPQLPQDYLTRRDQLHTVHDNRNSGGSSDLATPSSPQRSPPGGSGEPSGRGGVADLRDEGGMELNVDELRQIAERQQQHIASQVRLLKEKEDQMTRMRAQEERQRRLLLDNSRLRGLKEALEDQEMKLKRLRAVRSQVEHSSSNTENLNSELAVVKNLFVTKQRDLTSCLERVEALTRQLHDLGQLKRVVALRGGADQTRYPEMDAMRREQANAQLKSNDMRNGFQSNSRSQVSNGPRPRPQGNANNLESYLIEADQLNQRIEELHRILPHRTGAPGYAGSEGGYGGPRSKDDYFVGQAEETQIAHYPNRSKQSDHPRPETTFHKTDPKYQSAPGKMAPSSNVAHTTVTSRPVPVPENGESVAAFLRRQAQDTSSGGQVTVGRPWNGAEAVRSNGIDTGETSSSPASSNSSLTAHQAGLTQGSTVRPLVVAGSPPVHRRLPLPAGKTPPRYASRSVINNTYMKRMGKETLERYKRTASEIYRTQMSRVVTNTASPLPSAENRLPGTSNNDSPTPDQSNSVQEPPPWRPRVPTPWAGQERGSQENLLDEEELEPPRPTVTIERPSPTIRDIDSSSQEGNDGAISTDSSSDIDNRITKSTSKSNFSLTKRDEDSPALRQRKPLKSCLKKPPSSFTNGRPEKNSVRFHPLALLLDASLEGDYELAKKSAEMVSDVSEPNDEGITALHNSICAGHVNIAELLVKMAADVNAADADGWTPLHCAASCGTTTLARLLVEHGASLHARTISDGETALDKCDPETAEDTECEEYLFNQQTRLGVTNKGLVYALFQFSPEEDDELPLEPNQELTVLEISPPNELEWFLARDPNTRKEGFVAKAFVASYPRLRPFRNPAMSQENSLRRTKKDAKSEQYMKTAM